MKNQITTVSRKGREGAWRVFAVSARQLAQRGFLLPTVSDDTNGGLETGGTPVLLTSQETSGMAGRREQTGGTPVVLNSQTINGRDACSTTNFRRRAGSSFDTILKHSRSLTRTCLAISRSQSPTWLSRTTTASPGLNLTRRPSETGSGKQLEIASAGTAGAGVPALPNSNAAFRELHRELVRSGTGVPPIPLFSKVRNRPQPEVLTA